MSGLTDPSPWRGPSSDPRDQQFGHVVAPATPDAASEYDVAIVGEPYDGAVIGRPGAAAGPEAIRDSLAATKTHHVEAGPVASGRGDRDDESDQSHHHDGPGAHVGICDLGDVVLPEGDPPVSVVQERLRGVARQVHDSEALPVFLGGDNSVTYPNAAPLLEQGSLGILSFDAHLDCRAVPADGPTSGTPYRQLHEDGLDALAVLGARDFETSTAYHDYLHEQGGRVFTPTELVSAPIDALDDAIASLGDVDAIYVSVDVDVLDAAAAPGVSAPTPGGLSTRELYRLLDHVAAHGRIAGFEVVECAPPLDRDGRTVDAAARAVAHFLASLASPTGRQRHGRGADA